MRFEDQSPQRLTYETVVAQDAIPYLAPLRLWRRVTYWAVWCVLLGAVLGGMFFWASLAIFLCSSTVALTFMTLAGVAEVSLAYAIRHLILAIVLLPVLGLGVFLITRLVEADLVSWRLALRPPPAELEEQ